MVDRSRSEGGGWQLLIGQEVSDELQRPLRCKRRDLVPRSSYRHEH